MVSNKQLSGKSYPWIMFVPTTLQKSYLTAAPGIVSFNKTIFQKRNPRLFLRKWLVVRYHHVFSLQCFHYYFQEKGLVPKHFQCCFYQCSKFWFFWSMNQTCFWNKNKLKNKGSSLDWQGFHFGEEHLDTSAGPCFLKKWSRFANLILM